MPRLQNCGKLNLRAEAPRPWYSVMATKGAKASASLGGVCCQRSDSDSGGLERESNVRRAGARRGFRATAQSAKGLPRGVNPKDFNIGLGPAPEHDMSPHPLTPKNPGHRGPTAGSWQPRAGLWLDGPSETTASVHCTLPRRPERAGTCPYFPWPQRLFELTFTSSRRPGQALSDDVA